MTKQVVNLTRHTINEVTSGKRIPTSGIIARVKPTTKTIDVVDGIPIYQSTFSEVAGLPEPKEGVIYVVSSLALNSVPKSRTDVVAPGAIQKDENNNIIGCIGFRIN